VGVNVRHNATGSSFAYGLCNCGLERKSRHNARSDYWATGVIGRETPCRQSTVFLASTSLSLSPGTCRRDQPAHVSWPQPQGTQKIWWYRERMYSRFDIAKGGGKARQITAPDRRLKILQSKLTPLLDQLYRVRNPVHGFVENRSVKTNAKAHRQRRFVVNLDLKDFFPTITEIGSKACCAHLRSIAGWPRSSRVCAALMITCHRARQPVQCCLT
jgi:hypothetical protein